jgi:hypothetical protein
LSTVSAGWLGGAGGERAEVPGRWERLLFFFTVSLIIVYMPYLSDVQCPMSDILMSDV